MDTQLLNKLSNLTFFGFYNPHIGDGIVTVHFFNEQENKPDIMAYLMDDMSWDVREIAEEQSVLYNDKEVVTILHKQLEMEEHGSKFDEFVRLGLTKMAQEVHGEDANLPELDAVFRVFENNSYE